MTSTERVLAALDYQRPDRIPLFETYWDEFIANWRRGKQPGPDADIYAHYGVDIAICVPDETPWPSRAAVLEQTSTHTMERDGWGATHRTVPGGFFFEEAGVAMPEKVDPDKLEFEPPRLDARYDAFIKSVADARATGRCPFAKTGGPYLRATNLRGVYFPEQLRQFYAPLLTQTPVAKIGRSIFIYHCDAPWWLPSPRR